MWPEEVYKNTKPQKISKPLPTFEKRDLDRHFLKNIAKN